MTAGGTKGPGGRRALRYDACVFLAELRPRELVCSLADRRARLDLRLAVPAPRYSQPRSRICNVSTSSLARRSSTRIFFERFTFAYFWLINLTSSRAVDVVKSWSAIPARSPVEGCSFRPSPWLEASPGDI